jgi:Holliday junction resolvasome RuvABC endonuclease subunit
MYQLILHDQNFEVLGAANNTGLHQYYANLVKEAIQGSGHEERMQNRLTILLH